MTVERKQLTKDEKSALVHQFLSSPDKMTVQAFCEKNGIAVGNFYNWKKAYSDGKKSTAVVAVEDKDTIIAAQRARIAELENTIADLHAQLMRSGHNERTMQKLLFTVGEALPE